jgi:hypothetical protein
MPTQYELLGAANVNGIMQGLQDQRLLPPTINWVRKRVPLVPAVDEEIMARFIGTPVVADIIADDAKAVVYSQGRFQVETTKIPNLKYGIGVNQSTLNQLDRLQRGFAPPEDKGMFEDWKNRTVEAVRNGVLMRMEILTVAMLIDALNYDRLGIKLSGVTWGMPTDLKVTPSVAWDTAGSATPVNDVYGILLTARVRYGISFNRITMSTTAFRYMIATTEFQNKAKAFLPANLTAANLPIANLAQQQSLAEATLGVSIEIDDRRYWQQAADGSLSNIPILPITTVLLTDSRNDGDGGVYDFANGVVTESIVSDAVGGALAQGLPVSRGPVAYVTPASPNLNPPGYIVWGVARGFPRKRLLQSSATLSVGTFADSISTAVPFPA